ncbi:MAG: RsmG family class I SAM-dependent methyltransferase [Acidimicrobiales bacterium]
MDSALAQVLDRSRAVGFLGPGPVEDHIGHAGRFGRAIGSAECRFADIGAGGGVPGLPMLIAAPGLSAVLIDASRKRCSFLVWAIAELGLAARAEVWCGRAEQIGREARARQAFDAVVARGFGPPAVTLECGAPLLKDGGRLVVSEPPVARRWPVEAVASIGLRQIDAEPGVAVFERVGQLPPSLPRSTKQLKRSPLFVIS